MDAIVWRYKEIIVGRAEKVLKKDDISLEEKLIHAFMAMRIKDKVDKSVLDELHKAENALLHEKTLNMLVTAMTPILVKIIEEGIEKKVWSCRYPMQYMQIFLAASLTLTDEGMFELDVDSQRKVMEALVSIFEKMLDVPEDFFMKLFVQNWA